MDSGATGILNSKRFLWNSYVARFWGIDALELLRKHFDEGLRDHLFNVPARVQQELEQLKREVPCFWFELSSGEQRVLDLFG